MPPGSVREGGGGGGGLVKVGMNHLHQIRSAFDKWGGGGGGGTHIYVQYRYVPRWGYSHICSV